MKDQIILHYNMYFNDRINSLREMITGLTEDAQNDAKGSAGDKHETGLAMMHLEQEKLNQKLSELLESRKKFTMIDYTLPTDQVVLGSLIQTPKAFFLMSVALPKIDVAGSPVFALSPQSPLGALLMGKQVGASITFNGANYVITAIL